jgi:hypothetical protein
VAARVARLDYIVTRAELIWDLGPMRRALAVGTLVAAASLPSTPAYAWGAAAHRYIMRRAIELLPQQIRPFFDAHRDELILRVNDPDLWRTAGWPDDPNHFLDFGVREYGAYPFSALPRDYDAAVEKFGLETLRKNGLLPWREAEEFGNLRRAFESFARGDYALTNTVLFASVVAHYIQDAHQPLHATDNYDGMATGQNGVHARFESALFDRFQSRLTVAPAALKPIENARDFAFETLLGSNRLVERVLAADKAAAAGKDVYDDDYFERFFGAVKGVLEQRLGEAISATAGLIAGAWEKAGRPELKAAPRPPQPVKKRGVRSTLPSARAPRGQRA